jgi:DNA-binding NtrC family response regulator
MHSSKTIHIVTTLGIDGACCAALLCQIVPGASIDITSARRLHWTLQSLPTSSSPIKRVAICGVGIQENLPDILDGLRALKRKRIHVDWYCGRGYLDTYRSALAPVCSPVFLACKSNTQSIAVHHQCPQNDHTQLILALAKEYAAGSGSVAKGHQDWHDYLEGQGARYFKFDDTSGFIRAIRLLAHEGELRAKERQEIEAFRLTRNYTPLGKSKAMQMVRALIQRIAPIPEPVLILGPTGSGKEVAARMLHEASQLKGAFVPVNCAVLSTNADLAHDRLFGHVPGAYTGAKDSQPGAFVLADEGTLFLDELAELPLEVQTQLLRVLEEETVTPLGTMKPQAVNVRLVAATNQNLAQRIADGQFRADLYHRLNVLTLSLPSLMERPEDMNDIAKTILYTLQQAGHPLKLTPQDWKAIYAYHWPGNIRQFRNMLKRAAYMKLPVADVLEQEKRGEQGFESMPDADALRLFRPRHRDDVSPESAIRKSYIRHVYGLMNESITQTARVLGMAKNTLKKWLDD